FKQDSKGILRDAYDNPIANATGPQMKQATEHTWTAGAPKAGVPVHLKDIHLEMGMQCVDCHFQTDMHSDGKLYGETRNAVTVECVDCHGTAEKRAVMADYLEHVSKEPSEDPLTGGGPEEHNKWETRRRELLAGVFTGN